jgi:predicted negative regulator of RcsB-dependent stress response
MATHLDLEEQEQLDQLKAFWQQYGNLVTWLLIAVLAGLAAWNGWNWWQRDQAVKASAMYDELDSAAQASDADRAGRVFADMRSRYPNTAFTEQGGLLAAKVELDKGQRDNARATLGWVADNAAETEYRSVARLRLAGLLLDDKKYDEAMKQLDGATAPQFAALVDDRRGDIALAQGKAADAKTSYMKAWQTMDSKVAYRRIIDAKLGALGVATPSESASAAEASK